MAGPYCIPMLVDCLAYHWLSNTTTVHNIGQTIEISGYSSTKKFDKSTSIISHK